MQHQSSREKITPSSPAKVLGSPVPWHGRPASFAFATTSDQEEACIGNKVATFEPQRPQAGARKWTFSPLNHTRSLDAPTKSSENGLENTSMVSTFPPTSRDPTSSANSSTSSSSLGYPEVSSNDMRNSANASGTSSGSPRQSPIHVGRLWEEAIASQEVQNVQQLFKCGFDPCGDGAEMQKPPLILAVLTGNDAVVKLLLTAGADINGVDSEGLTALHFAAAAGNRSLVKLLLVAGADLYARTKQGLFPMHLSNDDPTYQLLSQRLKSDMENPTQSWIGLPHEPSPESIAQLESQTSYAPQKNLQTQGSASFLNNERKTTLDESVQDPKRDPIFFRHAYIVQSDLESGLNKELSEGLRLSAPSSSNAASPNKDADAKLAKYADNKHLHSIDKWISRYSDKDAVDRGKQFMGSENMWLQNLFLDKANSQDAANAAIPRNQESDLSGGIHCDGKDATSKSPEGSPQKSSRSSPTNSTLGFPACKLQSQPAFRQADRKPPDKHAQEAWKGFGPMMDGIFKSQEDSLCVSRAPQSKDGQANIADSSVSNRLEKKISQQATPAKGDPECSSPASIPSNLVPGQNSGSKRPVLLTDLSCESNAEQSAIPSDLSCDCNAEKSIQPQKQRSDESCVLSNCEDKEAFKEFDHQTGNALNCSEDTRNEKKTAGSKLHEKDSKGQKTLEGLPVHSDDLLSQEKEKKQVKFVAPSEADLAIVRKDWHDAARAGCLGCGAEGCGGKCLPKKPYKEKNKENSSSASSSSKSKKNFKKAQMKKTKNFEWKRGELLGEGAYGKVFCGLNQSTGELMAVKQLKFHNLNDDDENAFYMTCLEREISMYKEMRHKHIVGYIDMDKDEDAGYLYIFLEFVSGGSIQSMLERFGPFSEPLVGVYTRQLLLGLEYLHKNRIVHRDIKGGNVLVDSDGVVKLADFGASKAFHEATITDACKSIRGSIFWMAPEVIKGDNYGRHADIWSVGCTVIEMLTAMHPWPGIDNSWAAIFQIAKASSGPPIPETASDHVKDFLANCFHLDPKMRPSASQLLEHLFVAKAPELEQKVAL